MAKTTPSKSTAKPSADTAAKAAAAEKVKADVAAAQAVADEKAKADAAAAQAVADEKAKADAAAAQAVADEKAKADAEAEAEAKALADATKATGKVPALRVTASRDGFRRGGRAWNKGENIVAVSELTDEQIKQIKGEDKLTVEEIEIAAE